MSTIDYKRVGRAAKGIKSPIPEPTQSLEVQNNRLRNTVEVQKGEIRRLQRLLGIGLLNPK